jgi:hypothetical protein
MQAILRAVHAAAAIALALLVLPAAAATTPSAVQAITQVRLTEKQVLGFIAAQKDMAAVLDKIQGATAEQLPPQLQAELEAAARKHGFKDFAEYDLVVDNVSMVMAGIDPKTKVFTEPSILIKKEIEAVTADKSMPEAEKKQLLEELNEALKAAQPIQFPTNIELVKKYYDRIEAALS